MEFQSELADLARAGNRAQVAYRVRLLASAWRLRAELGPRAAAALSGDQGW